MAQVDQRIRSLVVANRQATPEEQQQIIAHVAQAPVSAHPVTITRWLRQALEVQGVQVATGKQPAISVHLLKRIYFDGQWPVGTTVEQFARDLHQAVQHPEVQLWTYRWLGEVCAGLLAPSHVRNVPHPEAFIFIAYNADNGTITTGFQASGPETIFTDAVVQLRRHRQERAMDLQGYASSHIEAFLLNYEMLVRNLAEVAAEWPTLDEEERGYHRATLLQTWGNRQVLGQLFRAGRLTQAQQTFLAELDRLLLEQAPRMEQCYGLALPELLAIFRWGTPLSQAPQPVRLEVKPAVLDRLAMALTPEPQR